MAYLGVDSPEKEVSSVILVLDTPGVSVEVGGSKMGRGLGAGLLGNICDFILELVVRVEEILLLGLLMSAVGTL